MGMTQPKRLNWLHRRLDEFSKDVIVLTVPFGNKLLVVLPKKAVAYTLSFPAQLKIALRELDY